MPERSIPVKHFLAPLQAAATFVFVKKLSAMMAMMM